MNKSRVVGLADFCGIVLASYEVDYMRDQVPDDPDGFDKWLRDTVDGCKRIVTALGQTLDLSK